MDPPFHLLNLITVIFFLLLSSQIVLCDALTFPARRIRPNTSTSRRQWLSGSAAKVISAAGIVATSSPNTAIAAPDEEYNNPNIPAGPEERCKRHFYYYEYMLVHICICLSYELFAPPANNNCRTYSWFNSSKSCRSGPIPREDSSCNLKW